MLRGPLLKRTLNHQFSDLFIRHTEDGLEDILVVLAYQRCSLDPGYRFREDVVRAGHMVTPDLWMIELLEGPAILQLGVPLQ